MQKHPPDKKYPAGLEWVIFKKIPLLTVAGFLVLGLLWAVAHIWPWTGNPTEISLLIQRLEFTLIGAAIFHLTIIFTMAIGCVVVLIMKGPRYTADSYPVEDADQPRTNPRA